MTRGGTLAARTTTAWAVGLVATEPNPPDAQCQHYAQRKDQLMVLKRAMKWCSISSSQRGGPSLGNTPAGCLVAHVSSPSSSTG
jgi:hypothetical protein